ncbi:MAG: hypothetical protein ABH859_05425 [Pseudomonadota bacterium]
MINSFDHLFVLGRPACGKSEFLDFMKSISDEKRSQEFHINQLKILDDFVWLWEKFEEDNIWEKLGQPRFHSKRSGHAYALKDAILFDFLLEKINQKIEKTYLANNQFYNMHTLLIEFSRGGEKPYAPALNIFSSKVLKKSAILYIEVSGEESVRRNEARYIEKLKFSVLAHKTPDEDMQRFYKQDDWPELTKGKREGFLLLNQVQVPFVTMNNEPESKDPVVLGPRYKKALDKLWELKGDNHGVCK